MSPKLVLMCRVRRAFHLNAVLSDVAVDDDECLVLSLSWERVGWLATYQYS